MAKAGGSGKHGGDAFAGVEKMNAQLFTLTYGAVVTQLVQDYEEVEQVNKQLDTMGYNIGIRIVDEFFAKVPGGDAATRCRTFRDTAHTLATVALRMFLDITAEVTEWNADGTACTLVLPHRHPLADFVELPDSCAGLKYSNMLCGAIRGALEMLQMRVSATFVKDVLAGDSSNEIRLQLQGRMDEEAGDEYKDD